MLAQPGLSCSHPTHPRPNAAGRMHVQEATHLIHLLRCSILWVAYML